MVRGEIETLTPDRIKEVLNNIKKGKYMPIDNWKKLGPDEDWPTADMIETLEDWDDEDDDLEEKTKTNMQNIFIDSKIKKQKISKEIVDKIKFSSIQEFMDIQDGEEAYLGAYSEAEFFAYRFRKVHAFYPDLFRMRHINPAKFITEFFKYADIPAEAYYKSYDDDRGDITINMVVMCIETGREDKLYFYIDTDEVLFFYNKEDEKNLDSPMNILISLLKGCVEPKIQKNKIYVVYQNQGGFEKTGFSVKKINVDLEANYNDGFPEVSEEIVKGLNDKKKTNLVILRGAPGTGKTTYIRYLTHKLKKNIIFISPDMVNHITDPSFIPFLIKNSDAVLIIEDGEPAIGKRDISGRTGAVSNILNLTDGLLSDCLNISIVVTLNTDNKDIDPALERKGRLLKHYTFEKLAIDKSKALLKKLGRGDVEVQYPMTLADIYFHGTENDGGQTERKKIGFGN